MAKVVLSLLITSAVVSAAPQDFDFNSLVDNPFVVQSQPISDSRQGIVPTINGRPILNSAKGISK